MAFKKGDRVTPIHPWHDGYQIPCTILSISEDGLIAELEADEPCFDIGKYELSCFDQASIDSVDLIDN